MPFKTWEFSGLLREKQLRAAVIAAGINPFLLVETEHFFFYDDAEEWLEQNTVQGGDARAVKYKAGDGSERWLVGAKV
ncbi:hypothetical protein V1279_002992 [Bradyrhizobium sp. AZCC 1610]|uniref:hypothetical protein n=1 Tax=Bradyrhizobium sp. AZCC 1610 TaxID=3117020 RepID=UPI002FF40067